MNDILDDLVAGDDTPENLAERLFNMDKKSHDGIGYILRGWRDAFVAVGYADLANTVFKVQQIWAAKRIAAV